MVKNNNFIDPGYPQLGDIGCYKLPMEGKRIYSDNTEIPEMPSFNRNYKTKSCSTKSGLVSNGKIYLELHKKDLEEIIKLLKPLIKQKFITQFITQFITEVY